MSSESNESKCPFHHMSGECADGEGLVAESFAGGVVESAFFEVESDGQGFQLREGV
jgi:hypothetical protein